MMLQEKHQSSLSDLACGLRVSAPTMTGIVDRLVKTGYAKRIPSREDRRVINVVLSAKGIKFAKEIRGMVKKNWKLLLSKLPLSDCENYISILGKIQSSLDDVQAMGKKNV